MAAQRVVGDEARLVGVGRIDDRHRHVLLGADFRRRGVVAAGMGDHQAGAVIGQFAQRRAHVAIAEAGRRHELEAVFLGHRLGRIDALLVPAEVGRLLRRQDGDASSPPPPGAASASHADRAASHARPCARRVASRPVIFVISCLHVVEIASRCNRPALLCCHLLLRRAALRFPMAQRFVLPVSRSASVAAAALLLNLASPPAPCAPRPASAPARPAAPRSARACSRRRRRRS